MNPPYSTQTDFGIGFRYRFSVRRICMPVIRRASCAGFSCLGVKSRAARAIPTRLPDKRFYDRYAGRRIGALGGTGFMRMLSRKFPCLSEASLELAAKFERSIETRSAAPCVSRHTCQEPLDPAGSDSGRAGRLFAPGGRESCAHLARTHNRHADSPNRKNADNPTEENRLSNCVFVQSAQISCFSHFIALKFYMIFSRFHRRQLCGRLPPRSLLH